MIHMPDQQPQHMQALAKANRLRLERAALREWVREPADSIVSRHRLASILDTDGPVSPCVARMPVEEFLRLGWNLQYSRVTGCCELAQCQPYRELGRLTDRQRRVIAGALRMGGEEFREARHMHSFERQHGIAA